MRYIIMATQKSADDNSVWEINVGGFRENILIANPNSNVFSRPRQLPARGETEFLEKFPEFKMDGKTGEMVCLYKKEAGGSDVPVPPLFFIQRILGFGQFGYHKMIATSSHVCPRTGRPTYTWTLGQAQQ